VFVGPEDIAHFHGVSKQTVYNHITYGTLIPEFREKKGEAIRFRLSEALKIDFKKLGRKLV
jgi:predicted DNA-binding transcriptional regulator AlpA